jgi:hypothetical protein
VLQEGRHTPPPSLLPHTALENLGGPGPNPPLPSTTAGQVLVTLGADQHGRLHVGLTRATDSSKVLTTAGLVSWQTRSSYLCQLVPIIYWQTKYLIPVLHLPPQTFKTRNSYLCLTCLLGCYWTPNLLPVPHLPPWTQMGPVTHTCALPASLDIDRPGPTSQMLADPGASYLFRSCLIRHWQTGYPIPVLSPPLCSPQTESLYLACLTTDPSSVTDEPRASYLCQPVSLDMGRPKASYLFLTCLLGH